MLHNCLLSEALHPCPLLMWNSIETLAVHPVTEDVFVDPLENASDCVASLFLFFPLSPGSLSPSTVRSHDARGGAVMLVARRICMVLHKMPAWLMTAWWAKHLFSPKLQLYPFATQHKVSSCSSGCVEWNNVLISPLWTILYCGGFIHYFFNTWPPTGFGWNALFSENPRREL